jgi:two-component system KDP operon response regulator KdpE
MSDGLIVEDDAEIRRFLRTTLSAEGYRSREAITVAEALARIGEHQPDAILDLGLPDGDGMEVIRRVRQRVRNLPIIVISVRSDEYQKITALDAGADDFINKPFSLAKCSRVFASRCAA